MERAFIVSEKCSYFSEYQKYRDDSKKQRELVVSFMNEKGIESDKFLVTGTGLVGVPFENRNKSDIRLAIIPTNKDTENFKKYLTAPKRENLCYFKATSTITKEFAQKCVDEQVIINLHRPRLADWFKSVGWSRYSYRYFEHNGTYYATIDSDSLDKNETPEGFEEIKLSEIYKVIEEIQEKSA